jgi:hypothetical protein
MQRESQLATALSLLSCHLRVYCQVEEIAQRVAVGNGTVIVEIFLMGAREDATNIFKALFKDNRVNNVTVTSLMPVVDNYDNKVNATGASFTMES